MSGSTIGGFVGGGIGFLFGGPAGAKWGWTIGSLVGGVVDPQKIQGPRLTDAQRQTSQEGVPIPFGFGTFPCMGNIIFAGPLDEHKHKEGGKGGPQTITYTYTRSFAIGFCEAPFPDGIAGFLKVLINGKLVYDVSPDSEITAENAKFLEYATLYTGSETQNPDPTMEAIKGAGNVSAHRGLAFIMFTNYDCTDTQGAIPQVEVVVRSCGTVTTISTTIAELAEAFYYPLQSDYADAKGHLADLVPAGNYSFAGAGFRWAYPPPPGGNCNVFQGPGVGGVSSWTIAVQGQVESGSSGNIAGDFTNFASGDHKWAFFARGANGRNISASVNGESGAGVDVTTPFEVNWGETFVVHLRRSPGLLEMFFNGSFVNSVAATGSTITGSAEWVVGGALNTGSTGHLWGARRALTDNEIRLTALELGASTGLTELPDAPGVYIDADGNLIPVESTSIDDDCTTTLAEIVTELCTRAGIDPDTELDVSELTDTVDGFVCATESDAAGYIEALRLGYFFDCAEWDKKLRFPKRGKASVASLTTADLVRLDEDKPCIQQTEIQEAELLRKVNVLTLDPDADYRQGKQTWERRAGTIQAKGESSIEIPVVCTADTAAQMAEKRGKVGWGENVKFRYGLPPKWSKLTATDVIDLTDKRSVVHHTRLQDMNELAGLITIEEAVKTRRSIYTASVATGSSNDNSGGGTGSTLAGPTLLAIMNLPQLRSQDGSGVYVGMAGMLPGWKGGTLLFSFDGGLSYQTVLTVNAATTMGYLTSDRASGSEPLQVRVYGGSLSSATTAQVAAGANYSAVITAGVAEIMAYEDATETSADNYDLETTTWELKGTAPGLHLTGDQFVDLSTAYLVLIDMAYAGQTIYAKAVAFGVSADAVTAVTFVYDPAEIFIDGGEVVGPLGLLDRAAATITDRFGQAINSRT